MTAMQGLRFVTVTELEALARQGGPVVVAFVATWNRRCQGFADDYLALATRWAAVLPVVCVDVDESSALTATHDISSVPTLLLIEAGRVVHREVGLALEAIEARLLSGPGSGSGQPLG